MVSSLLSLDSASGIPILWCCFFQTIAIGWIFGVRRFAACVEQMTGYKPSLYWIATWGYIAPIVMAVREPCPRLHSLPLYVVGSNMWKIFNSF